MKKTHIIILLLTATSLGGCAGTVSSPAARHDTAVQIAHAGALEERMIPTQLFNLTSWQRLSRPGEPVHVYIEGDGLAWLNRRTKSLDPTPPDPMALRLAVADTSSNVVYIARPCQYSGWNNAGACPSLYWTSGRTAHEVIQSYQEALNSIKAANPTSGFHLIGYSGGAAVAALAAAERQDILSLRTVAGNMDYTVFSNLHHISPIDASLNPSDAAAKIAHIPQRHFIGAEDKVVPQTVINGWKAAAGNTTCIETTIVPDAAHEKGWTEKWPSLLTLPLPCTTP